MQKEFLNAEECKELLFDFFKDDIGNKGEVLNLGELSDSIGETIDKSIDSLEDAGF